MRAPGRSPGTVAAARTLAAHRPGEDRLALDGRSLVLVRPVRLGGERAGTVHVRASGQPMADRLRGYGLTVLLMTLVAMGVAVLISARLQRTASRPILLLAETARAVAQDDNYSLRVPRLGGDELGTLTDDFNVMLARIQEQDGALRAARDEAGCGWPRRGKTCSYESAERRRAEEFNQRLMQAVQNSREMITIADPDDHFIFVNRAFLAAYGLTEEELVGQGVSLVDSPNNPPGLRLQIAEATLAAAGTASCSTGARTARSSRCPSGRPSCGTSRAAWWG